HIHTHSFTPIHQFTPSTLHQPPTSTLFPYTTLFRSAMIILRVLIRKLGLQIEMKELEDQAKEIDDALKKGGDKESSAAQPKIPRSEEHTSELQSPCNLVCRLLLEKKKKN